MSTIAEKINTGEKLLPSLEKEQDLLSGSEAIRVIRRKGVDSFSKQGLPARKSEEYKYSPVSLLFKPELAFRAPIQSPVLKTRDIDSYRIPQLDAYQITLVNGFFSPELSALQLEDGMISVSSLSTIPAPLVPLFTKHFGNYASIHADPFTALNTAVFADVLFISIPEKKLLDKPIQILNIIHADSPVLISPRILIHVGKGASVQIIENYIYTGKSSQVVSNALTEIVVEEGSRALFYKIQDHCTDLNLISTTQVLQKTGSHFDTHTVTLSGKWIRNNLNIVPDGEHCETHLNGLFILNGAQHTDNHTLVDHRKPNCESNQLYRGILDDKSTGVFNGKIYVRPDAQKTNAYQSSKNMLLSDEASMNTKPQLEIYADDVKCSHGSSTGQIDEDALFYLRARGLSIDSARALLMLAFARDVVNTIRIDALRTEVERLIEKRLTK